ncbi:alpha-amylase family glycosyl hydrolase [Ilumatobacter sp.]|uniref:alpha-amylase family glycosyl hydrolase n=1 Tax=Ilumatobacter sp. TaxID=1967498 RepID=UPI003B52B16D
MDEIAAARTGCTWRDGSATWRVWAPNASGASVRLFDGDDSVDVELADVGGGCWQGDAGCDVGTEYLFVLETADGPIERRDPCARDVTDSVGRCVVVDGAFEWQHPDFTLAPVNELVIYELHVATFAGTLDDVAGRLDHLTELGVNCIELMPVAEFAGDVSWGYNPAAPYAVESAYGGPEALRRLVDAAHGVGIGVVLDVVYNHLGPSDLDLWRFDGWFEGDGGGIYFYADWRAETPWGATRPDFGRDEVRAYLIDNALMWLQEYRIDGLRLDMTSQIRNAHGGDGPDGDLDDGRRFLADLTDTVHHRCPGALIIAEDLQQNPLVTTSTGDGGLGFDAQWAAGFVHPVRAVLESAVDEDRDLASIASALDTSRPFARVVYTESHDEVANGRTRVTAEIDEADPDSWAATRRAAIGAVLVMAACDVPMLFQGQEWADEDWFDDQAPLAWHRREERPGTFAMWRDLIRLRTGRDGRAGGLRGDRIAVHHLGDDGVLGWLRWGVGGLDDAALVVANLTGNEVTTEVGVPGEGTWAAVFDSTWSGYHRTGSDTLTAQIETSGEPRDDQPFGVRITLDSYASAIFARH